LSFFTIGHHLRFRLELLELIRNFIDALSPKAVNSEVTTVVLGIVFLDEGLSSICVPRRDIIAGIIIEKRLVLFLN
jgi:hypothetical protein